MQNQPSAQLTHPIPHSCTQYKMLLVPLLGSAVTEAVAQTKAAQAQAQTFASLAAAARGSRSSDYAPTGVASKRPRDGPSNTSMAANDMILVKNKGYCFRHVKHVVLGGEPCPNGARCTRPHTFEENREVADALAKYGYQKQK
jgi:hypothetical protein